MKLRWHWKWDDTEVYKKTSHYVYYMFFSSSFQINFCWNHKSALVLFWFIGYFNRGSFQILTEEYPCPFHSSQQALNCWNLRCQSLPARHCYFYTGIWCTLSFSHWNFKWRKAPEHQLPRNQGQQTMGRQISYQPPPDNTSWRCEVLLVANLCREWW